MMDRFPRQPTAADPQIPSPPLRQDRIPGAAPRRWLGRWLGRCLATGGLATMLAGTAAATPSASDALSLKPLQRDAVYELVPSELIAKCTVTDIDSDGVSGWEVTGPDGTVLRRFLDTNSDKRIDVWSYFNFGVEAYRDIDADFNGKADQYRWLGNTGTRWGIDRDEDGQIDSWKRISAEEVSAEVVAAVRDADPRRFARLLATPSEIRSLGLGEAKTVEIEAKAKRAASEFATIAKQQQAIGQTAEWIQFAAPAPGLVPAGTAGSSQDVVVYENVVAMYENEGKSGQLMVGTLVQVDDRWRMVGLPNIDSDGSALTQSAGLFFTPGAANGGSSSPIADAGLQTLVTQLESIDEKLQSAAESALPQLHSQRADLLEKLIAASGSVEDRTTWTRQLIDTVSVAVQSRQYPDGLERLKAAAGKYARQNRALAAYADYQAIQAEYVVRQTPDADFEEVQEWYLTTLADFVDAHPRTEQSAQAMLQLALSKEFEENEEEALVLYKRVRDGFKDSDPGAKAAGAVNRLESVGRKIELAGKSIDGKTFQLSSLRGRPVIVHYWATWCEPCKQDMKLLNRLQARYKQAGLTLIGINVDALRSDAEKYIQETRLPWTQLFEEGGLESSRLAQAFGVQTLPTMMLIDKNGVVVRHNVRSDELDAELDKMLK
ncbi:redoxin domain-containing protein [Stieleria sp. TO1_6]|uniref:redoxin domain-containing protein n=1 Tax=Stieleria tagensis TaxID=2956795 RepID=UPI00209B894B|nr:redoxin domain-containing protein [Stieleria tagensis]MCO8122343.1 redoxin domain-containing protein [Stieleria tagensis]